MLYLLCHTYKTNKIYRGIYLYSTYSISFWKQSYFFTVDSLLDPQRRALIFIIRSLCSASLCWLLLLLAPPLFLFIHSVSSYNSADNLFTRGALGLWLWLFWPFSYRFGTDSPSCRSVASSLAIGCVSERVREKENIGWGNNNHNNNRFTSTSPFLNTLVSALSATVLRYLLLSWLKKLKLLHTCLFVDRRCPLSRSPRLPVSFAHGISLSFWRSAHSFSIWRVRLCRWTFWLARPW